MSPHDLAVLAEATEDEQRVLREANAPICDHLTVAVLKRLGGGLDDHATDFARCLRCGEWLVITTYATRDDAEVRPMTPGELARFTTY